MILFLALWLLAPLRVEQGIADQVARTLGAGLFSSWTTTGAQLSDERRLVGSHGTWFDASHSFYLPFICKAPSKQWKELGPGRCGGSAPPLQEKNDTSLEECRDICAEQQCKFLTYGVPLRGASGWCRVYDAEAECYPLNTDLTTLCVELEGTECPIRTWQRTSWALGGCDGGWTEVLGHCFKYSSSCKDWLGADEVCARVGGHLASISGPKENDAVSELCNHQPCWIGLREPPGSEKWEWSSGSISTWRNWHVGEPNNYEGQDENRAFVNGYDVDNPVCWYGSGGMAIILFSGMVLAGVVVATPIFACFYLRSVTWKRPQPFPSAEVLSQGPLSMATFTDFRFGMCGCCEDCSVCMHACFCFAVRVGDTYSAAGVTDSMWSSVLVYCLACCFGLFVDWLWVDNIYYDFQVDILARIWVTQLVLACFFVPKRQRLRARFAGTSHGFCCQDFLTWWCCPLCVAVQEARQVDLAQRVSVRCCCQLWQEMAPGIPSGLVGSSNMPNNAVNAQPVGMVVGQPTAVGPAVVAVDGTTPAPQFMTVVGQPVPAESVGGKVTT